MTYPEWVDMRCRTGINGRVIWYYKCVQENKRFIMSLVEMLKAKEVRDYLQRVTGEVLSRNFRKIK